MDSNFSVKITADIGDLQNRLKAVEVELGKFSKSTDRASTSMKGMEQNANRGRLTAFAFGQVVRDAGFFANSFSLGILAISNNVPILIDQLSLSVKALAPFAGAISLAGSALTALLTIWSYNLMATEQSKKATDDYIGSVNAVSQAHLKGAQNAAEELTILKLLYNQTQNTTLSNKKRKEAVDDLQELYPSYFKNLSDEAILAGNGAKKYQELTTNILASARARAGADILTENLKKQIVLEDRINEAKKAQSQTDKQRGLQQQIYNAGSVKGIEAAQKKYTTDKLSTIINAKAIADAKILPGLELELLQLKKENLRVEAQINEEIKKGGDLKPDFGKDLDINTKTDAFKEFNNALKSINANQTTTELEKLNAVLAAQKTLLDALSKETYPGVANDMKMVSDSMVETKNQITALEASAKTLKDFNDKLEKFKKIGDDLSKRKLDIASSTGLKDIDKTKQLIEAVSDKIIEFQSEISQTKDPTLIDNLNQRILILKLELAGLKTTFTDALNIEIAAKNAAEWAKYLAQSVGGDLVNAFNQMLTTGKLSFESIGRALLGMIKKLAAAALAAAVLSAILSSLPLGGGGGGTGFKDMFKVISGVNLSGNSMPGASLVTNSSGINTSMATSSAMGSSSSVLETRVSGNDLVILLDRASNNRNKYF